MEEDQADSYPTWRSAEAQDMAFVKRTPQALLFILSGLSPSSPACVVFTVVSLSAYPSQ